MVTSSAVVGSSASSSFGELASAMAIITRWRMPPENWCGYWSSRRSAAGMPTMFISSSARARRARRVERGVRLQVFLDLQAQPAAPG